MATNTTNYGWTKPDYEDDADIAVLNETFDAIDEHVKTNENNISTVSDANGTKNLLDFNDWASKVNTTRATKSISRNSITLTATGNDAYTDGVAATCPASGKIACEPNTTYVITWETTSTSTSDNVYIFPANASPYYRAATTKYIEYTMPAGCQYFTFRFGVANSGDTVTYSNIMICEKSLYDISNQYKPYALSNAELTTKEKQNENNISSLYNSGQKNHLTINTTSYTASGSNRALKIPVDSISGTIHIYFGEITSTDTDDTTCGVLLVDSNDNTIQTVQFGRGTNKDVSVYVGNTAVASVSIYPATNWINSENDTVSITNGMICSQDAWGATGGSYEPYAMSNAAITAWIIAHS